MSLIERRYGISRTVWLIGPYAIKTPRLFKTVPDHGPTWTIPRAVLANQSEAQWSEDGQWSGASDGVAPVLRSLLGGLVNIYPRCEAWPEGPEPDYDKIGVEWLPRDRKPQNVGLLNGVPVWLDYDGSWNACPHERTLVVGDD